MRPVLGYMYTNPINPNACTIWPGELPVLHHLSYSRPTAEQTNTQPLFLMHFNILPEGGQYSSVHLVCLSTECWVTMSWE